MERSVMVGVDRRGLENKVRDSAGSEYDRGW